MYRLTPYNRRSPLTEMSRMVDRMQHIMDRGWPFGDDEFSFDRDAMAIDMHSDDDNIIVNAALPGLKEDDIHIDVHDDLLTISGESRVEREEGEDERNWHYHELRYGKFTRTVRLPESVDLDKAEATLQDGILTVTLPKAEPTPVRKIAVKAKELLQSGKDK